METAGGRRGVRAGIQAMKIPRSVADAFGSFKSGAYRKELKESERLFYTEEKLEKNPRFRLQPDKPPFLFEGDLTQVAEKYITWGMNPKDSGNRPLGETLEDYYREALGAFHRWPPSRFHERLLRIVAGAAGVDYPGPGSDDWAWAQRHYLTFDMVPYYAERFQAMLNRSKLHPVVKHLGVCEELLRDVPIRLVIMNGKPFVDLFLGERGKPPLLEGRFTLKRRIPYREFTEKMPRGEVLLGCLRLAGKEVPAAILSVFVHQARPPFNGTELEAIGRAIGQGI